MAAEGKLRLLVFDWTSDSRFIPYLREGATEANWLSLAFDTEEYACQDFDAQINALAVSVPTYLSKKFKGRGLLERANELDVPRAIITPSRAVNRWIREDKPDIILPVYPTIKISRELAAWLLHLTQI